MTYGCSQARGRIGTAAASLQHSHSHARLPAMNDSYLAKKLECWIVEWEEDILVRVRVGLGLGLGSGLGVGLSSSSAAYSLCKPEQCVTFGNLGF